MFWKMKSVPQIRGKVSFHILGNNLEVNFYIFLTIFLTFL